MMVLFLASSATIIGLGIAGITYAVPITKSYNMLKCSVYLFVNEALYGADVNLDLNSTWIGVDTLVNDATAAINDLRGSTTAFQNMANQPLGDGSFTNSQGALDTIGTTYDSTSSSWGVNSPEDGTSGFVVDMRTGWKDYTSDSSAMYPLYAQRYLYKEVMYNQLQKMVSASASASQTSSLDSALNSLSSVSDFTGKIGTYKKDLYDYTDSGDGYVKIVQLSFSIYYAVILGCVVAMVTGTVLFTLCGCMKCRCVSHLGWFILTFLMIIGFILSGILLPFSVVFIEACDLIKLDNLSTNHDLIPQSTWDQVGICLTGDGDLYKQKGLDTTISFASDIMKAFDLLDQLYNKNTDTLVYNYTDAYKTNLGDVRDKIPANASLAKFAAKNYLSEASNNCQGDLIVWTSDSCQGREVLTSGASKSGLCVPIKSLTSGNIGSMLGSRYDSCSSTKDKITYLVQYAESLAPFINAILSDIDSKFTPALENDNNIAKIKPMLKSAYDLKLAVSGSINKLSTMLQQGLNCKFLRGTFDRVYVSTCGYFAPTMASLSIIIILISLLSAMAIITLTYVNRAYFPQEKVHAETKQ